jgi:DNA-binding MarR family transcriptional regulator
MKRKGETVPEGTLAEALSGFMPVFNDKLASLFHPPRTETRPLTRSQVMALVMLRRQPGQTASGLGKGLDMTNASLTGILDSLESEKLVLRVSDSRDRRKTRLTLTRGGMRKADAIVHGFDSALDARVASLSPAARAELARHLSAAARILKRL